MIHALDREALVGLLDWPNLRRLLEVMNGDGEETRIVGGAVRNALIGRRVMEVDCASTALPDIVTQRARAAGFKAVPTGIEHGTITVVVNGEPFEVTTLREDVETDGRYALVRFGRSFETDALRRDFTINALSLGIDGKLYDYTDGVNDLAARRVRFIGDAHTRIREDYLRILRFFRFFAEYAENGPDADGLVAAGVERAGLTILSRERIRNEMMKLLAARRAKETIQILHDHGFLVGLLDGVAELGRFRRLMSSEHKRDAVARLAALAVMTEEDAERLRACLRLSNEEHRRLTAYATLLIELKSRLAKLTGTDIRRLAAEHGIEPLALVMDAVSGEPSPAIEDDGLEALERFRDGSEDVPVFPLRGADLVERGIPKGPRIGELLGKARAAWLADGCPMDSAYAKALTDRILDNA